MLRVENVSMQFSGRSSGVLALDGINIDIPQGQFLTILGPSGCGKSTLLHLLGGFVTPTSGKVLSDGDAIAGPSPERAMAFQTATLFPWRTVRDNVAWPLRVKGIPKQRARQRADELLGDVGLAGFEAAMPEELSGGMAQRAAIARTLAMEPTALLMDEPFGALDAQTREVMQFAFQSIWEQYRMSVIFVTHDIDEAVFLGDRVIVMSARPGRIVDDVMIDLPRPRSFETKVSPGLIQYKTRFWDLIRAESGHSTSTAQG
jgi:NitT/TauT family transport system ATP-binding protein